MKRSGWWMLAAAALTLVVVGACDGWQEERVAALETKVNELEARLNKHAQVSQDWARQSTIVLRCLAVREWGTGGPVVDHEGNVVNCSTYPDPPSPPDPNGEWDGS